MSALKLSALALTLVLGTAIALPRSEARGHEQGVCNTVSDPDPSECPFCGGNPALHIKAIFAVEKTISAVHVLIAR